MRRVSFGSTSRVRRSRSRRRLAEPWACCVWSPDRDAISVLNAILGGMFSSRINLESAGGARATRTARSSSFQMRHAAGYFTASAATSRRTRRRRRSMEIFSELRGMRDRPVKDEELETAKESIKRAMPGRFETVSEVTGALSDIVVYGLPLDEYVTRPARIDKITAADVLSAARAHLHPDTIKIVVVGDRAKLEPSLETLHLGTIEEVDPYGDPLAPLKLGP